jgi:DNA-binding transcriptional LysR family regulator
MNLNHLAIFHAVAQEQSVSRAAQRLLISQPAVSKQVAQLGKSLKVRLFDRRSRGIRLTDAGQLLASYAAKIFALEEEAQRALSSLAGVECGRLAIGASTTIGVYLLPAALVKFRRAHPGVQTTLEVGSSRQIQQLLLENSLDIGLTEVPPTDRRLKSEIFMQDELAAIAPPGHRLLKSRNVTAAAFCREPFVVRDTGSETRSFVERALAARGLSVDPIMSLSSTEAIKRAVAAGIGVGIVSRLSIGVELKARTLAVVCVSGLSIRRPLYAVSVKGATPSAASREFRKVLQMEVI